MSDSVQTSDELQRAAADRILDVGMMMSTGCHARRDTARKPTAWMLLAALLAVAITVTIGIWSRTAVDEAAKPMTIHQLLAALAAAPSVQTAEQVAALPDDTVAVRLSASSIALINSLASKARLRALAIGGTLGKDITLDAEAASRITKGTQVRLLELHDVTGLSTATIGKLNSSTSIEALRLSRAPLPKDLPAGRLFGLRYLAIEDRTLTGQPDETTTTAERLTTLLAGVKKVDELALINTYHIGVEGLKQLGEFKGLRSLKYEALLLTKAKTSIFAGLNIKKLDLSHSILFNAGVLAPLAESQHIECLDVSFIPRLSLSDFLCVGNMVALRELNLSGYRSNNMKSVFGHKFQVAAHKDIARCLNVLGRAKSLERVTMRDIKNVPLATLAKVATDKWHLDLRGTTLVAGDGDAPEQAIVVTDIDALREELGVAEVLLDVVK